MKNKPWLIYALLTTLLWGVWGALIELPEKAGFPATLGFSVWILTLCPVAVVALKLVKWKLDKDKRSILYGMAAGLFGCGGQLILFKTLQIGPAYIIFPIISLYPVVTVVLSVVLLKERASRRAWFGISLAIFAILLLSYQPPGNTVVEGYFWLILSTIVFLMWGVQALIMKKASNNGMQAESFIFYLMLSGFLLFPLALYMTDFSQDINWGLSGIFSAALIQTLNAVGFLFFAYSVRYGKAIIVVPLMSLAPVVTVILSLILYAVIPHPIIISGILVALFSTYLLAE